MPFEAFGIGNEIKDALRFAESFAVNMSREIYFPNETLELFSQTPSGANSLQSLTQDWSCERKPDNANYPEYPFEVKIVESATTSTTMNLASTFTIGSDKFRISAEESPICNLGVWKLRAVKI